MNYKGYTIQPKLDFGQHGFLVNGEWVKKGFVVTDGFCNIMPGGTWFFTTKEAKHAIDIFLKVKKCAARFWDLIQPFEFTRGSKHTSYMNGSVRKGRHSAEIENGVVTQVTHIPWKSYIPGNCNCKRHPKGS